MKAVSEPRIVALGGGTGLSTLLRGLKKYTPHLTAIVTVTDDGGSSGALRRELGVLPPGDIRSCLVALSEEENLMAQLFQYRFPYVGSLAGHSFGNLFLTAMSSLAGGFDAGIARVSEVLAIRGRVLPSTLRYVTLKAKLSDGTIVRGESIISKSRLRIDTLSLDPYPPPAAPQVIEAIEEADVIVMGPGSLYTSVIANLLVTDIRNALQKAKAPVIYVCNIMTQPGETSRYLVSDHLEAIDKHAGKGMLDYVVVNNGTIPKKVAVRYARECSYPVRLDKRNANGIGIVRANLVTKDKFIRHDADTLAKIIMKIAGKKHARAKQHD